ncbi:HAD-IC family P-type ATPase, partial [candidate division GN15 bacterium]|nr:HAD-IC family P-type ATPase [candidate division GN15 bacterium]
MAKTAELQLKIGGMHCASCVNSIEHGVRELGGVSDCRVNLAVQSASVKYDGSVLSQDTIIERIRQLGFEASEGETDLLTANRQEETRARHEFLLSLALAVPLMIVAMWPMFAGRPLYTAFGDGLAQACLVLAIFVLGGRRIFADAFVQARHLRLNMNSLVALGTLTAFGWSVFAVYEIWQGRSEAVYFESAGMIITLILLGRMLEGRAKREAGSAIEELLKLRPSTTTAIINGVEVEIDAAAAQPGMVLLVKPGERVPADGEVVEGKPVIDESVLTGESVPVEKGEGSEVIGGSVNGNTPFQMEVSRTGEASFLAQVVR